MENLEIKFTEQKPTPGSFAHSSRSQNSSLVSGQAPSESPTVLTTAKSVKIVKEILQGSGQLTTGPCCTVLHNHDTANYYALLLTQDLIDVQREITERTRKKTLFSPANLQKIFLNKSRQPNEQTSIRGPGSGQQTSRVEEGLSSAAGDLLEAQ